MYALSPVLITPPAVLPVTAADADGIRAHSRIDTADEDGLLDAYIAAATQYVDGPAGVLGRALITQTWRQDFRMFGLLRLPLAPVQSITSVTYWDGDNASQTLSSDTYVLREDAAGAYVDLAPDQSWPAAYYRPDAVSVTFVAGYGDAATDVPEPIRQAIRMMVAHWYEHREAVTMEAAAEMPLAARALLGLYRRVAF